MRMSHIYQPAMLIELLLKRGAASLTDVAKALLARDVSQIEYYESVSRNMVGRVLARHGITDRKGDKFSLMGFDDLSPDEIDSLVALCTNKIDEFVEKRCDRPWAHRRKSAGYIKGTIRYEVLKRAKFRRELCGGSADEKALEVDHIVPRNNGGTDDLSNFQSLCYSCNAMKRDRDDTDFRGIADS